VLQNLLDELTGQSSSSTSTDASQAKPADKKEEPKK
jgi:hypothetical protein